MEDNKTQPSRAVMMNRLKIGLVGVVLLIIAATATALILKAALPKKVPTGAASVTANETVALYSVPGAITGLSENLYDQQVHDGSRAPVIFKLPDHEYAVSTLTPRNVLFYAKNQSATNDTQAIQDQTNVFMQSKGYKRVANSIDDKDTSSKYATYTSDTATCQLISSGTVASEGVPVSHQLVCADNDTILAEYNQVDKFLHQIYNGKSLPGFTLVTRTAVTENDKSFVVLNLKTKTKSPALLFAAVNEEWSYIGDLSGDGAESNGKYTISSDVKAKVTDPKYNGFLARYLLGTAS